MMTTRSSDTQTHTNKLTGHTARLVPEFCFAEAFVVNRKGERGPMSRSQTDKRTHTAPDTRTPPPRLGRERDERMEQPEGGDKNTYGRLEGKRGGVTLPGSPGQPRPFGAGR